MIWDGEIGNVTEVHAWTDRPIWPQGLTADSRRRNRFRQRSIGTSGSASPKSGHTLPAGQDYKSPLGGTSTSPFNWRGFYDFGCGALGDMACHILGAPNLALQLGAPASVECIQQGRPQRLHVPEEVGDPLRFSGPRHHASGETVLARRVEGNTEDPRRTRGRASGRSARKPSPPSRPGTRSRKDLRLLPDSSATCLDFEKFQAAKNAPDAENPTPDGSLFIGDKGMITTGTYGEETRLIPVEKMRDYQFPPASCSRARRATTAIGFAPARAAIRRVRTSMSPFRSWNGCCWA